jgi:hypothetical protein
MGLFFLAEADMELPQKFRRRCYLRAGARILTNIDLWAKLFCIDNHQ